ncbi:hypothetical protein LTR95_013413, partial [Oleoguttula sp. CCFEE 5521]
SPSHVQLLRAGTIPRFDLPYDEAEDCAAHLRLWQDRPHGCESARGDLPGVRAHLPGALGLPQDL